MFFTSTYRFCNIWKMFVQPQFRTRYCGHTLSRLGDFGHNMTKQVGFPTVRRRESEKVKPSMACVLHSLGVIVFIQCERKAEVYAKRFEEFQFQVTLLILLLNILICFSSNNCECMHALDFALVERNGYEM